MNLSYDQIPVPVSLRRTDGRYAYVNPAWCDLFSLDLDTVIERTDRELALDPLALPPDECCEAGELIFRDVYVTTRHRGRVLLELVETRVADETGGGVLCVHQDMTGIGWRLEDLARAHEDCERRCLQRLQSLSNIAQSLREGLDSLDRACPADAGPSPQGQTDWKAAVQANVHLLVNELEQMLASKAAGETATELQTLRVDRLVEAAAKRYRQCHEGARLDVSVDPRLNSSFLGDAEKLKQILLHMLDTIVPDGDAAQPELSAHLSSITADDVTLSLALTQPGAIHTDTHAGAPTHGGLSCQMLRGLLGMLGGRLEVESNSADGLRILRVTLRLRTAGN